MKAGFTPQGRLLGLMPELDGLAMGSDRRFAVKCASPEERRDVLAELRGLGFTMDSYSEECETGARHDTDFPHPLIMLSSHFVACCTSGHSTITSGGFVPYDAFMDAVSNDGCTPLTIPDGDAFNAQLDMLFS